MPFVEKVTSNSMNKSVLEALGALHKKHQFLLKMQATGQKIDKLSEDPTTMGQGIEAQSTKRNILQTRRNSFRLDSLLNASHGGLNACFKILERARELSIYGVSGFVDGRSYGVEVNGLIEQLSLQINQKYLNTYLFAASKASENTPPFQVLRDANNKITQVNYIGGLEAPNAIYVDENSLETGIPNPSQNQALAKLANDLITLRNALDNQDERAVKDIQGALGANEDVINLNMSSLAAKIKTIKIVEANQTTAFKGAEERLSKLFDVDQIELSVNLKNTQYSLDLAETVSSHVLKTTGGLLQALFVH